MAIVVIIIGVLMSGILGGAELVEVNKRNSLITDLKKYGDATLQFKDKYRYLPGDYPYGLETFPEVSDGNGNYTYYSANGDGDGNIDYFNVLGDFVTEELIAFSQLGRAGFIKENFVGIATRTSNQTGFWLKDDIVVPKASYKGVYIRYLGLTINTGDFGNYSHIFFNEPIILSSPQILTAIRPGVWDAKWVSYEGFTSVENVYKIDEKMDDKNPATGDIVSYQNYSDGSWCSTWDNNDPTASTYNFSDTTSENCTVIYLIRE